MELLVASHEQIAHEAVLEALKGHHSRGESAYLLVPEQFTLQSDIHLLEALEVKAVMDIKVKSFASLAREVLGRIEGAGRQYIGSSARELVFYQAVLEENDRLCLYKNAHRQTGVLRAIATTVANLHAAGISTQGLQALADRADLPAALRNKCHDMALLQDRYEQLLGDSYLDGEARLQTLVEILPQADYLKKIHLYFDAFQRMSALELTILDTLKQMGVPIHVVVTLPYGTCGQDQAPDEVVNHEAYASNWAFATALKKIAGPALKIKEVQSSRAVLPDLAGLAKAAFSTTPAVAVEEMTHLGLMQAPTTDIEVETLAALLRKKVVEDGCRWRDITVSVTAPDEYFPLVRRIFGDHDIPVFIDEKRYITDNPLLQGIFAALNLVDYDFRQEDVFAYLKSGLSAIDARLLEGLEHHARARKLRGQMFFKEESYAVDEERFHSADRLAMAQADARAAKEGARILKVELEDFYLSCQKEETVLHFSTAFYHFISQPQWTRQLTALQEALAEWPNPALVQENEQIFNAIVEFLEQLVTALGQLTMPFKEYARLLREGLENISIGIIPPAQDQVLVGALSRTRTSRTPIQLILGLSDAWYPAVQGEAGVFAQDEQDRLKDLGIHLGQSQAEATGDEAAALFQAFTRPTERLVLSWPGSDHGGQTMNRSRLIRQVEALAPQVKVTSAYQLGQRLRRYSKPLALRDTLAGLRRVQAGQGLAEGVAEELGTYYRFFMEDDPLRRSFLQAGFRYTNRRLPLTDQVSEILYPSLAKGRASVSELESMCACPYQHFIRYGIRPHEEEVADMKYNEIGSLIHAALKKLTEAYSSERAQGGSLEEAEVLPLIRQALEEETSQIIGQKRAQSGRNHIFGQRLRRYTERTALQIFRQLGVSDFKPAGQEVRFGRQEKLPAVILDTGVETIRLEGIIDRIDAAEDAVRIVDYKTGSKTFDLNAVAGGLQLQLLLYLRAALASGLWDRAGGIFYLRLRDLLILDTSDDPETIAAAVIDALLLDGIVIDDPAILEKMDPGITETGGSILRLKGRAKAIEKKTNVLSAQEMDQLMTYAEEMANCAAQYALAGLIDNAPLLIGQVSPCQYCDYRYICRFEAGMVERTASADDLGLEGGEA